MMSSRRLQLTPSLDREDHEHHEYEEEELGPILTKSSDCSLLSFGNLPSTTNTTTSSNTEEQESLDDSIAFLKRIHKGIFLLGWELGFLVQASTVDIQYVATSFLLDRTSQLALSLLWSYALAVVALIIFYLCQKTVHVFMQEVVGAYATAHHGSNNNNNHCSSGQQQQPSSSVSLHDKPQSFVANKRSSNYQQLLHDWKVDLQCQFVQGSLVGVFTSWVFLDVLTSFRIRVIYGGIIFLLSLLFFMAQILYNQHLDFHQHHHHHVHLPQQEV